MIATRETARPASLAAGLERGKLVAGLGLAGVLAVSAVLNLWNLAQNGYDNLYYSVAVQSMLQSWHNFFAITQKSPCSVGREGEPRLP